MWLVELKNQLTGAWHLIDRQPTFSLAWQVCEDLKTQMGGEYRARLIVGGR